MRIFAILTSLILSANTLASDISECKSELTRELYSTINYGMSDQEVNALFSSHDLLIDDSYRADVVFDSFYDNPIIQRDLTAADLYRKYTGWFFWRTETIYFLRVGFDRRDTVVKKECSRVFVGL